MNRVDTTGVESTSASKDAKGQPQSAAVGSSKESYTLDRDELIRYIEVDLWEKFRTRLFRIVGFVLTAVTAAGLLGIPYYINREVAERLENVRKNFEEKSEALVLRYKVIMLLEAQYEAEKHALRQDIGATIADLEGLIEELDPGVTTPLEYFLYRDITSDLWRIATSENFSSVTQPDLSLSLFRLGEGERSALLSRPRRVYAAARIGQKTGTVTVPHPALDGTLGGTILDLRIRLVILEAFRQGILSIKDEMVGLGSVSELEEERSRAEAEGLRRELFVPRYEQQLREIGDAFLTAREKSILGSFEDVYGLRLKDTWGLQVAEE